MTTMQLPLPVAVNEESVGAGGGSVGETLLAPPSVTVPAGQSLQDRPKPPMMIDRAEAYYWTAAWQDGMREAVEALMAGKYRRFDSDDPLDLARWLLNEKED
jgi:hypothetical protein